MITFMSVRDFDRFCAFEEWNLFQKKIIFKTR